MATVELVVHTFRMGDVDDPDLYAAEPLWDWQCSEAGTWIMAHAVETPIWSRIPTPDYMGHTYIIRALLTEPDAVFYQLKYGHTSR